MGRSIDSINQAIVNGFAHGDSNIKKVYSCSSKSRPNNGDTKNCNQSNYTASYTSKSGGKLIFRGTQTANKLFFQPTITYSTTIDGKKYRLSDQPTDVLGMSHAVSVPDGKIALHDTLTIDGVTYELQEAHAPNATDVTGIFELKAQNNNKAKYNGLLFGKQGDKWVFVGPDSRREEGEKLKNLLQAIETQYSSALNEAADLIEAAKDVK